MQSRDLCSRVRITSEDVAAPCIDMYTAVCLVPTAHQYVHTLKPQSWRARERASSIKPKFHYADFHRNFPAGKVVDTNHESRRHDLCGGLS